MSRENPSAFDCWKPCLNISTNLTLLMISIYKHHVYFSIDKINSVNGLRFTYSCLLRYTTISNIFIKKLSESSVAVVHYIWNTYTTFKRINRVHRQFLFEY